MALPQSLAVQSRTVVQNNGLLNSSTNFGAVPSLPPRYTYAPSVFDGAATFHRDIAHRFGERLREMRRQRNLTQLQMAKKFGIDRSFISDVERGRKSISLGLLEVIALGLRVSLSDLFRDL